MSAAEASKLEPSKRTVIISILDQFEESSRPAHLDAFADHLSLSFVDTFERTKTMVWPDEMSDAEHLQACGGIEGDRAPALSDASKIIDFVTRHHESPEEMDLVVHCFAGKSRSAAVAKWVTESLGTPIPGIDAAGQRLLSLANKRVLRLLRKAANTQKSANQAEGPGHPWHDALSLEFHQAAVARILAEPACLARASETLERWISMHQDSRSMPYFLTWREIIRTQDWATALAETDAGQALRSSSPLVFVLPRAEIEAIRERALTRRAFERKRSQQLQLSFPYDWSNPGIPDDALILNVLKRGIFEDICRIARHYGLERVEALGARIPETMGYWLMHRMMRNIRAGFARARQSGRHPDLAQPVAGPLPAAEQAEFEALALQLHRRNRRQDVIDLMGFMQRGKTLDEIYAAALAVDASCSPVAADCVLLGLVEFDQDDAAGAGPGEEAMREAFTYFEAAIDSREVAIAINLYQE